MSLVRIRNKKIYLAFTYGINQKSLRINYPPKVNKIFNIM